MLVSGLCIRNKARKTPVLGGGGTSECGRRCDVDHLNYLVGSLAHPICIPSSPTAMLMGHDQVFEDRLFANGCSG